MDEQAEHKDIKKGNKTSSHPSYPTKISNTLWARAAGRCEFEGCNRLLCEDWLTGKTINGAQIAHILPVNNSARAKEGQSEELKTDINNLMLLCYEHHNLIDKSSPDDYPEEVLLEMKKKHEDRIRIATEVQQNKQTLILLYGANISNDTPIMSFVAAQQAISPEYYIAQGSPVRVQLKGKTNEHDSFYWQAEATNLEREIQTNVLNLLSNGTIEHVSLFGLAPQPLLVKLGTLLNEKYHIRVFQKIRVPDTWRWQIDGNNTEFILKAPDECNKQAVIVFAISADAIIQKTIDYYKGNASIWVCTVERPDMNLITNENQLMEFKAKARFILEEVSKNSSSETIHIHMAMPVSCAIELGRVWMPKAHKPLCIYEHNQTEIECVLEIK